MKRKEIRNSEISENIKKKVYVCLIVLNCLNSCVGCFNPCLWLLIYTLGFLKYSYFTIHVYCSLFTRTVHYSRYCSRDCLFQSKLHLPCPFIPFLNFLASRIFLFMLFAFFLKFSYVFYS